MLPWKKMEVFQFQRAGHIQCWNWLPFLINTFGDLTMLKKEEIRDWFLGLQERICIQLEEADGKGKFFSDPWHRSGGGGGIKRVIQQGKSSKKGR